MKGTGFSPYTSAAQSTRALAPAVCLILAAAILLSPCAAQTSAPQPPPTKPSTGQVIFSRSTDENGQTTTRTGPAAPQPTIRMAAEPTAQDAERQAVTFTDLDLDVRLRAAAQHIAVHALLTVRNDGKTPLVRIPLQISSALNWERIRVDGKDIAFPVATLNSDADHTGQLHEAAVALSRPLAPGAALQFDVAYSGVIAPSAQRLLAIGTPENVALHSDWDRIGVPFTGLRGFGNVVWYPVSSVPVILGDGARLFDEIGEHKLRMAGARLRLRLTVEFPHGQPPTVALIDGQPAPLAITDPGSLNDEVDGVATAGTGATTLGFEAPSLFVAIRTPRHGANLTAFVLSEDEPAVAYWRSVGAQFSAIVEKLLAKNPAPAAAETPAAAPIPVPSETSIAAPVETPVEA